MKSIFGVVIGLALTYGYVALAETNTIPFRDFGEFRIGSNDYIRYVKVVKFVDPDNGNVCYISHQAAGYGASGGISCVKP